MSTSVVPKEKQIRRRAKRRKEEFEMSSHKKK